MFTHVGDGSDTHLKGHVEQSVPCKPDAGLRVEVAATKEEKEVAVAWKKDKRR